MCDSESDLFSDLLSQVNRTWTASKASAAPVRGEGGMGRLVVDGALGDPRYEAGAKALRGLRWGPLGERGQALGRLGGEPACTGERLRPSCPEAPQLEEEESGEAFGFETRLFWILWMGMGCARPLDGESCRIRFGAELLEWALEVWALGVWEPRSEMGCSVSAARAARSLVDALRV